MNETDSLAALARPEQEQAGRVIAIAQLLRAGHSTGIVVEALKYADRGDLDGALRALGLRSSAAPEDA